MVPADEKFTSHLFIAESKEEETQDSKRRMAFFLKEHLLPICIDTNAMVLLYDNSCSMSQNFGKICDSERKRLHGVLPFTVMAITGAHMVCMRAESDHKSLARQIRDESDRWTHYNGQLKSIFRKHLCITENRADFPPGITHAILVSAVSTGKKDRKHEIDTKTFKMFKSGLVERLARDLPNFALSTYSQSQGSEYALFADYVGRKLPIVFIDSRVSKLTKETLSFNGKVDKEEAIRLYADSVYAGAKEYLESLDEKLHAADCWNFYDSSTLAYLITTLRSFSETLIRAEEGRADNVRSGPKWLWKKYSEKYDHREALGRNEHSSPTSVLRAL
jgi:hypothetical protein